MTLYLLLMFVLVRVASCVSDPDSHRACQQFTADKEIKNLIVEKQKVITPCPCVNQKIELDYSFEKIEDCYRQRLFGDGVKQMCCYSSDGNIQTGAPQGGYILFETLWKNMSNVQTHCCREETMCDMFYEINPSDDCSAYQPLVTATSFGDPNIETIDGYKFDFNGHGEYVFLKTNDLEIQARLGYVTPGNIDATLFEAFAIFDNKSGDTFEIQLNRSEKADIRVYKNGTLLCNANRKQSFSPCENPQKDHCMVMAGGGQVAILSCGVKDFAQSIAFTPGKFMSLTIATNRYAKTVNISGLAGHQKNGSFDCRNGTKVNVNSSAPMLFSYAESWSLENETASHFNYTITGANYSFFNGNHTRPRFLEDVVGNLTELFKGYSAENISKFNETCRNYWDDHEPNKQCLLTIARSNDYNLGLAVMVTANETRHKWEIYHNKAPYFLPAMPDTIKAVYKQDFNITINLKERVWDEDKGHLYYNISTGLSVDEYTLDDGVFTWNVNTSLRDTDTRFTFYVIDRLKMSGSHDVTIKYCGCDDPSECNFDASDEHSSGNMIKAKCKCPKYFTGLYCEKESNPCKDESPVKCFLNNCSKDFDRLLESWPCAPCPKGRHSVMLQKEQKCRDIDECATGYSGDDKCDHNCTNTNGSFICSCRRGYTLNSNKHSCDDIDDCVDPGICSGNEICINKFGGYDCVCKSGYNRKGAKDACTENKGPSFVGSLTFTIGITGEDKKSLNKTYNTESNRKNISGELDKRFKGTPGYIGVEVTAIMVIEISANRTRRSIGLSYQMKTDYIVHWNKTEDNEAITKSLLKSLNNYTKLSPELDIKLGGFTLRGPDLRVYKANESGLCSVPSQNDCEPRSTECRDGEGIVSCQCKRGYIRAKYNNKHCEDFDECHDTNKARIPNCSGHGTCSNTNGGYTCNCAKGFTKNDSDVWNVTCEDINECSSVGYACTGGICNNTIGGWECSCNSSGFIRQELSKGNYLCVDIDECSNKSYHCENGTCNNTIGNWSCTCPHGYDRNQTSLSYIKCEDVDECLTKHCSGHGNCSNTFGGYTCNCNTGFVLNDSDSRNKLCEDIDECNSTRYACAGGICNNTIGGWECACKSSGFIRKEASTTNYLCTDIDECSNTSYHCGNGICNNTVGSWSCTCPPGYEKNNASSSSHIQCDDINECMVFTNNSSIAERCVHGTCVNTPGSWNCSCTTNRVWQNVGNKSYPVYRCQGNYTYIGIIDVQENGNQTMIDIKNLAVQTITGFFQNSSIENTTYGVPIKSLYVGASVLKTEKDETVDMLKYNITFNIRMGELVDIQTVAEVFQGSVPKNVTVLNGHTLLFNNHHIFKDSENMLCSVSNNGSCDMETTYCQQYNGSTYCICKQGYSNLSPSATYCKEIDECTEFKHNSSIDKRCVHGTCVNTPGSWNCNCPANKLWQNVGNESYPVYRCQGDYQYIGEIKLLWIAKTFQKGQVRDFLNETIESLFSKKDDLNISFAKESPHMHEVFLSVEYLNATVDNSTLGYVHVTSSYILHLGESVTSGWVEKYQLNAFNKSNSFIFNDGTNVNIIGSSIFNESGKNLCNIPNKTKCDLEFTTCSVHNGSYSCACKSGFHVRIDDHYCKDIDECKEKHVVCGSGNCSNTVGSWECLCNETSSFRRINDSYGVCEDTNECIDKSYICHNGTCHNTIGGWKCVCQTGYYPETIVLDKIYTCTDKDECKNNATTCSNGGSCVNLQGNWTCKCPPGFENRYINQSSINCTDVNECTNGAICLNGGSCVNIQGSWECKCPSGFENHKINETFVNCTDIDECKKSNYSCEGDNNSSRCHNLPGSWNCSCIEGYKSITVSETARMCKDIDECTDDLASCEGGECRNTVGGWYCECPDGYTNSSAKSSGYNAICTDIDECGTTLKDRSCLDASECVNTVGSWKCICRDGFTEYVINKTSKTCGDIDECGTTLTDISCLEASACVNTVGSWKCICGDGFTDNVMNKTSKICEDIDECGATLKDISCLDASECVNTIGSWKCLCSDGYTEHVINKTSKTCEDDYQYVASVSFSLSGEITDGSEIKEAIKKKIMEMYIDAFNDPGVWIEILKITVLPETARQKRSVSQHDIKTDYVVHTTAEKTKDELNTVETVYRNGHSCVNPTVKCPDEIDGGFKIRFVNIQTKNSSAICETNKNYCDHTTTTCVSTNGQLVCNCTTEYPQKKSRTNCIDPCQNSKCHETSTCSHWNNDDGYICGCRKGRKGSYCTEIDLEMQYKKQQTTSIAVGSSLGALVLILAGVIFGVCRWRAAKIKEAEKIDSSRFKNFDDSFLKNQYMRNSGDGGGSLYSHRLSNVSIPRVKQNGDLFKNQNGHISNSLYAKPQKQQKPDFHGSMPNLAHGDAQFYPSDYRRLSDQYPNRFSGGYDHALSASCNDLRNVNGWTSPVSDYDRFGLPNPDYNPSYDVTRPRSPKPDYDRRGRHDAFKDSGVGNGYSSDSNDIRRTDQRRGYPNEYRYSDTKF